MRGKDFYYIASVSRIIIIYQTSVQETMAVTGKMIPLQKNERKGKTILAVITTALKCQVPVAAVWSVQFSPYSTSAGEKDFWNTVVPAAQGHLSLNSRTVFAMLSNAIAAVSSVYDTEFWQLTESHERETGDSRF